MRNNRNDNRRQSSRDSKGRGGRKGSKFAKGGDWLMMQVGVCFLDETNNGFKTRVLFSSVDDQYSWCVREGGEVTHWFGVEKGRELFLRAIEEGNSLGTSAFFDQRDSDGMQGNARINIKNVITNEELEEAEQAAVDEAWEENADEEDEDERPVRKSKAKAKAKSKTKSKAKAKPEYDLDDVESDEDDEETDDDEEIPY